MGKIVLFGDSLMAGFIAGKTSAILDRVVIDELSGMGFPGYEVVNQGQCGDVSADGVARVAEVVAENADFVAILFGDNDAVGGEVSVETFGENLRHLVRAFDLEKVVLLTPTYVDTALQTNADDARQQSFVEKTQQIAAEVGIKVTNMYHHMTVYPAPNEFLQADGLHLSNAGYHLLGALIARNIKIKLMT